MEQITKTQKAIFDYIESVLSGRGITPSVREIASAVGLKSTSSVQYNLNALEKSGYIQRDPNLKRTIRIVSNQGKVNYVPLIGTVTAGLPILATQSIEEYIPFSSNFTDDKTVFALKIRGDSMVNAGILDGDIVFVEQSATARNGDIVVALIDEEATVKRFFKDNGCFRLQPENDNFEPIIVKDLQILGKVVSVIRYYWN